jgi:hypothetical protein
MVGLAIAGVLIFKPAVVSGLADEVGGFFVDNVSDTSKPEPTKQHRKNEGGRQKDATQRR